jgi:hypothetical protein
VYPVGPFFHSASHNHAERLVQGAVKRHSRYLLWNHASASAIIKNRLHHGAVIEGVKVG